MASYSLREFDHVFEHDGIQIRWTTFGSGPPLIFLHGTPWSSQLWLPIARRFSSQFTVFLYDMPGYGQSISLWNTEDDLTYPAQTKVFSALLDHWALWSDRSPFTPHVVAHDIGGHIALRAHLLEGRQFDSLALVDCGASYPVDEPFFSLVRENTSVFTSLPPELHEALLTRYLRGAAHKGLRQDQLDMLVRPYLGENGQRIFYTQIKAQRNEDVEDLRDAYRKLDIPLLIIWAKEDTWVPVQRAQMLHQKIGGTVKIVEGAGHLIHFDAPEELLSELIEWLIPTME